MINRAISIILILGITGCGSTPKRDDHAEYVNLLPEGQYAANSFSVNLAETAVDVRGYYNRDDGVESPSVLYAGDAGAAGMLAQIAVHSAMINSQRSAKLASEQSAANAHLGGIYALLDSMTNQQLMDSDNDILQSADGIMIKPIFFISKDLKDVSLTLIATVPKTGKASRTRNKFAYRNVVQVKNVGTEALLEGIEKGDKALVKDTLKPLLKYAMLALRSELSGAYKDRDLPNKTYRFKSGESIKIVRGKELTTFCNYRLVKDIRHWLTIMPTNVDNDDAQRTLKGCSSAF